MKLKAIHQEIRVQVNAERMWQVLSQYGDVSRFHAGVVESHKEPGSGTQAAMGCERECNIVDMGLHIMLKERIIEFVEGKSYKYEIYEWKNFPIRQMLMGFRILQASATETLLGIEIAYLAKPAFLTPLLAPKMRRLAHDVLLGYKHYAETGEMRVPIKALKARYKDLPLAEVRYG